MMSLRLTSLNVVAVAVVFALQVSEFPTSARGATIASAPFSIGYGYVRTGAGVGVWNTSETAAANTPTIQGDFSFTPTVAGLMFSNAGPTFPNRVLTNGAGSDDGIGSSQTFSLSITGAYTGAIPPNTLVTQTSLNITELRIHGMAVNTAGLTGTDLAWNETTVGLLQSGPMVNVISVGAASANYENINNWTLLSWNPTEQFVNGLTQTRAFNFLQVNPRAIEGLEIFGFVEVSFIPAAPEPGTGLLLGWGALCFARRVRRGQREKSATNAFRA